MEIPVTGFVHHSEGGMSIPISYILLLGMGGLCMFMSFLASRP